MTPPRSTPSLDAAFPPVPRRTIAPGYDISRIIKAAVHLMPDHTIPSEETGTRHRTADRAARQTGFPVISVSQSMLHWNAASCGGSSGT